LTSSPINFWTKLLTKAIFSRVNTRELVSRSQRAKIPAELKDLGGCVKAMLDQQNRNMPEHV